MDASNTTPQEAADAIRDDFLNEPAEPGFIHRVKFAELVCECLGVSHTPWDVERVLKLLERHSIDGSTYAAFPGWFENDRGDRAICDDEAAMEAFMSRPDSVNEDGTSNPEAGTIDAHGKFIPGRRSVVKDESEAEPEPVAAVEHNPGEVETA